ncbi:MAG: SoxR reducing system RseC family protein [Pseudomonadota bacterium]
MLEARGRVVAIEAGRAWVESARESACGSCSSKGHCGTALFGDALTGVGQVSRVLAVDPIGVAVGDEVVLGLPEEGMLRASLLMYGMPISGLIGGLAVAQPLGDGVALLVGVCALLGGLALIRPLAHRLIGHQTQASILARVETPISFYSRP